MPLDALQLIQLYRDSLSPLHTLGAGRLAYAQQEEGRRYQEQRVAQSRAAERDQAIFEAGLQRGLEESKARAKGEADRATTELTYNLREEADTKQRTEARREGEDNAQALLRMQDQYDTVSTQIEKALQLTAKELKSLEGEEDPELRLLQLQKLREVKALDPAVQRLTKQRDRIGRNMDLLQRSSELYFGPEFRQALEAGASSAAPTEDEMSAEEAIRSLLDDVSAKRAQPAPAGPPAYESANLPPELITAFRTQDTGRRRTELQSRIDELSNNLQLQEDRLAAATRVATGRPSQGLRDDIYGGVPPPSLMPYDPTGTGGMAMPFVPDLRSVAVDAASKRDQLQAQLAELQRQLQSLAVSPTTPAATETSLINAGSAPSTLQVPLLGSLLRMRADQLRSGL